MHKCCQHYYTKKGVDPDIFLKTWWIQFPLRETLPQTQQIGMRAPAAAEKN